MISRFDDEFAILPKAVPPSFSFISAPSASRLISAGESTVISPYEVARVDAASPVLISSRATPVDTVPKDNAPLPSVFRN